MVTKKTQPTTVDTSMDGKLHQKYRPTRLDRVIGQEVAVTRIRGMIETGKIPSAIAFFGPPSSGKTTLGRVIGVEINGRSISKQQDFKEVNAADERGIDDVRELIRLSKYRPMLKKRIILIDEAHQLVSNNPAAQTLLKTLEEPSKNTLFIICSMEPEKFNSKVGKAILSRCTQFVLEPHTNADLMKQALRIVKGEQLSYLMTEDKSLLKALIRNSNQEMRTLANLMQSAQQYYDGLKVKPTTLTKAQISEVFSSTESADDKLAVDVMVGIYSMKFAAIQRALLDVADQFQFVKKLMWASSFMLNVAVLKGEKHPKLGWWGINREVHTKTKTLSLSLGTLAAVNARLIRVSSQATTFQVPATDLLSSELYYLIKSLASGEKE
jgi:DNA polymerase-3 subunit gamma/tau